MRRILLGQYAAFVYFNYTSPSHSFEKCQQYPLQLLRFQFGTRYINIALNISFRMLQLIALLSSFSIGPTLFPKKWMAQRL